MRSISSIVLLCATVTSTADEWYPSEHGAGDTLGAINHLSAEKVVEAARLVKTGKTYPLGVVTGWNTPAYPPRHSAITVIQPGQDLARPLAPTSPPGTTTSSIRGWESAARSTGWDTWISTM